MIKFIIMVVSLMVALAAQAAEVGVIKIQRRNPVEFHRGVLNEEGELTYEIDHAGRGILTVGSNQGNALVGDPFSIQLAPQRILEPEEWGATLDSGIELTADGTYKIFAGIKEAGVSRSMTIAPVNPATKVARVTYQSYYTGVLVKLDATQTEQGLTLLGRSIYTAFWDPNDKGGFLLVSNIVVYAWVGDARLSSVDFTLSDLSITDNTGSYTMAGLRQWIMARYDYRTGDRWSQFSATHSVRLADKPIWFDPLGVVRMSAHSGGESADGVSIFVNGSPVFVITPGATEETDQLKIVDYQMGATQATFYVSAALKSPITIQCATTLAASSWSDVSTGVTSTYPTISQRIVGGEVYSVYVLTLPLDPDAANVFYRVKTSVGAIAANQIEIKNATLVYNGHEIGIVTQVINGVTYELLGRVVD